MREMTRVVGLSMAWIAVFLCMPSRTSVEPTFSLLMRTAQRAVGVRKCELHVQADESREDLPFSSAVSQEAVSGLSARTNHERTAIPIVIKPSAENAQPRLWLLLLGLRIGPG